MIDDVDAGVVVWQEDEIGDAVREPHAQLARRRAAWLQHDGDGDGSYEAFLASGAHRRPRPRRRSGRRRC